jgi:uncharacterized membrane protein
MVNIPVLRVVLWVHIAVGTIALLAGGGAILTKKGSQRHRRFGGTFVLAMVAVVATALFITSATKDIFLASIGIFSGYMVFAGWRALGQKRPDRGDNATATDYAAASLMFIVGLGMVGLGIRWMLSSGSGRSTVLIAFGALGVAFAGQDVATFYRGPQLRFDWFYRHIARMLGGYIATVTAVSAVNLTMLPTLVRWLWPTIIGTPLIVVWVRRYQRRFSEGKKPRDVAATLKRGTVESSGNDVE